MIAACPGETLATDLQGRFVAIWQCHGPPHEREWIDEILGRYIREHVMDGAHQHVADYAIVLDSFIDKEPLGYYEAFRERNSFLVHFLDETYNGGYQRYLPFRGVLRKHWSREFDGERIHRFPLGYSVGFRQPQKVKRAGERAYVWSFVGALNKASRPEAVRALRKIGPHFVQATDGFVMGGVNVGQGRLPETEVAKILQESAFAPCPMGNVNLECFRIYEALEAGAVPLLERRFRFDYYNRLLGDHPLPTFDSWRSAARFVADTSSRTGATNALQDACVRWWREYKQILSTEIGDYFRERLASPLGVQASDYGRLNNPIFQCMELLKHQTGRAILRRIRRHAARFVSSGRFRDQRNATTAARSR